ncbi:TPA: hypothetical protein ACH3X1_012335 [Trebouxia sp. C0004]
MADPTPGTLSQEQTALRWNEQLPQKPSRGRTSSPKLLWTVVWVTLVLALSLYATLARRASQIKASYTAAISNRPTSTSPSTPFPTLAPPTNPPTLTITESTASVATASMPAVATAFPPELSCFPFCDTVMNLQPVQPALRVMLLGNTRLCYTQPPTCLTAFLLITQQRIK